MKIAVDSLVVKEKEESLIIEENKSKEQGEVVKLDLNSLETFSLDTRILKDLTIVCYFDDPILPYAFKEVINMPAHKELLKLYEASLPSWTVVLAQYGFYKPWFRFAVRYIIFLASLVTMVLGFWDLYKNVPVFKGIIAK
jgi:hypothetical protein